MLLRFILSIPLIPYCYGVKVFIFTITLLRNLDPPKLCNGTILCVKKMLGNVIEATILTGKGEGKTVSIPRIPLIPTDCNFQ
jgi:ATP-dependent DNA helicase PIF1